ncbi:unnamed protein product [Effrenium voratum]|nr:unnamed protein product [Effrenium voratum]
MASSNVVPILEVRVDEPPIKLSTDMLSGTVYAGSTARVIESNKIPFTDELPSPFSRNLSSAFAQGKGDRDIVEQLEPGTRMGQHLLDESHAQELTNSYLALTISAEAENAQADLTMWFKREAYHAVPIMVNLWNNARFQLLGMERSKTQVWSHPLPKTQTLVQEEMSGGSQVLTDLFVALTVILAMGFIPASFVVYLVHEKASSGKHQQLLTGISPMMYWFSSYCWDVVNFLVPLMVCLLIFLCFQVMAYSGDNLPAIVLVLFWYGVCMTPLMYCVEPLFRVPSTAYVTLICLNIFTGTISTLAITTLEAFEEELPDLRGILDFGQAVFPWTLPNYALGRSLLNIAVNHYSNFAYTEFGVCIHAGGVCWKDPLSWDVAGQFIFKLAVMAPIWFSLPGPLGGEAPLLRLLIEWGCFTRQLRKRIAARTARAGAFDQEPQQMDEVVLAESARVARARADYLVLDKLEKSFTRGWRAATFRAVRKISVGVPPGECFGLLGVNGAGKTTTMRMITGDTEITSGDILVGGFSVQTQRDAARRRLGYCPQFDALPDKLTVRETLQLYARIRGVRKEEVVSTADTMIQRMCLEAHQNQLCEFLSGGNKRKLSTVGARRFLWEVIGDIRKSGHAVVLTSHSMEECEVLCTRLTIMVHGQFRCLGSPVELKARYGGGYSLAVKSLPGQEAPGSSTEQNIAQLRAFVRKQVPWARLAEVSVGLLRYRLGQRDEELPLAEVFRRFEDAKDQLAGCLSDYSVSQTSLEEVFLHFSREAGVVEDPEIAAEDVEERPEEPCTIGAPLAAEPEELSMGAPLKDERQEAAIEAEADEEVQARDVIPL